MPLHPQDNILIEKHLQGQLSPEENLAFEARLNDPDFQKELELQQDLMVAFRTSGRDQLKKTLQSFEDKAVANTPPRFRIYRILAVAATVALLLVAGYFLLDRGPSNEELFASYFTPYPNIVNPIDKSTGPSDQQEEAFQMYERGQYEEAINQFNRLDTKEEAVYLYQGISELALGNTENALSLLENIKNESSTYFIPSQWYKALCLIKSGRTLEAIPLLEQVKENAETGALKGQALRLLEEVR